MSIAISLLAGATVFFAGFLLGCNPPSFRCQTAKSNRAANPQSNLPQEYINFLNYDGSVQN